jgi:hypothetical protein
MTTPLHQELLQRLAELCELTPHVRFGQLLDFLGSLCADRSDRPLAEIEDRDLLSVMEQHREELAGRQRIIA